MQVGAARLGHIGLAVRDLERSVAFYTEMVGLRLTESFEYPEEDVGHGTTVRAGAFVRCDSTHHCISIFALKAGVEPPADGNVFGLHHFAFEFRTPAELLTKYRELKHAGVPIVNARKGGPGNQPRFYARDPDGNLVEFYWGIDEIGWDNTPRAYDPIQEIDLKGFDFEAYVADRERAAMALRPDSEDASR